MKIRLTLRSWSGGFARPLWDGRPEHFIIEMIDGRPEIRHEMAPHADRGPDVNTTVGTEPVFYATNLAVEPAE